MLKSNTDSPSRPVVLSLVPEFKHASKDDFQQMFDLVIRGLADPSPLVRQQAGYTLAQIGNPSAIPYLETAIGAEREEVLRSQLQANLQALQKKAASAAPK
jgi:HEAT repeat protein